MEPHIKITQAVFTPQTTELKIPVVYLPGFSLSAKSKSVKKIGEMLSSKGFPTIAISSLPKTIIKESLPLEATKIIQNIEKYIKNNQFILVAHSKGASKAIAVLELLAQKPLAVILITPVGIYQQTSKELQQKFIQEIKENSFPHIKKEFSKRQKPMLDLAFGVLATAAREASLFLKSYPKRLNFETEELGTFAPQRAKKVLQNLTIPIIIGYTINDRVVDAQILKKEISQITIKGKHNNLYLENLDEQVTHGLPYTNPEIVASLVQKAEQILLQKST